MKKSHIYVIRVAIFLLLAVILFGYLNVLFQAVWYDWNNYNTIHGFYEEPENTLETVFLGSSVVANGIIPMQLYEDYGICAYNLGTEQQPMLASYYWLQEAYRLHSKSLKTVVLDMSIMRYQPETAFYRKAIDGMKFSSVKYRAVQAYAGAADTWDYLLPLASYHTRWSSLESSDFVKSELEVHGFSRGYHFAEATYVSTGEVDFETYTPSYTWDVDEEAAKLNAEALEYFEKTVSFCKTNGLKLVLMQAPRKYDSGVVNAVQHLVERHGLKYLTFCFEPLVSELGFNLAADTTDGDHLNYYGAKKLTAWFGLYLTQNCDSTDVRGNTRYSHLEKQLKEFQTTIHLMEYLDEVTDPADYLELVSQNKNLTVFIMVMDEATNALSKGQRNRFAEMGLHKLAALEYQDSYLAVIDKGTIIFEESESWEDSTKKTADGQKTNRILPLTHEGVLASKQSYTLNSGGANTNNVVASCKIGKTEYAKNSRGLNIVVYDNIWKSVMNSVCFDTYSAQKKLPSKLDLALQTALAQNIRPEALSENLYQFYIHNLKMERLNDRQRWRDVPNEDFLKYLDYYRTKPDIAIFLSVWDEATSSLDENARNTLRSMGLTECAALGFRGSYVAVINEGRVILEKRSQNTEPVYAEGLNYYLASGGSESGFPSSIVINGQEHSLHQRGFNVVIYDKFLDQVVDSAAFDTFYIPVKSDISIQ